MVMGKSGVQKQSEKVTPLTPNASRKAAEKSPPIQPGQGAEEHGQHPGTDQHSHGSHAETDSQETATGMPGATATVAEFPGARKAGSLIELAELFACSGWRYQLGKTSLPPSFGARPTRRRPASERGASGRGSCDTPQRTRRIPSPWISSSSARVASMLALLGSLGGSGEARRNRDKFRCERTTGGSEVEDCAIRDLP
jgi:hypothetical protein